MFCLICSKPISIPRKYCSSKCYQKSKFGRKRPDVVVRNKTNNPVWDKESLEKMRSSLTGKTQPISTRLKRSVKLKEFYKNHPEVAIKRGLEHADYLDKHPDVREKVSKNLTDYVALTTGTGWKSIRKKILKRDNHTCQTCGEVNKELILIHHKDWNGKRIGHTTKTMNNDPNNLITLCHKCHNGIHRHKSKDYQKRLETKLSAII